MVDFPVWFREIRYDHVLESSGEIAESGVFETCLHLNKILSHWCYWCINFLSAPRQMFTPWFTCPSQIHIAWDIFLKTAEVFTKHGEKRMLWLFFIHFFFIFYFLLEFKVKKYLKKFSQVHQWKIYRIYIKRITFTLMNQCCINYSSLREGNLSLLISRCTFSIPLLFVWDKTQ